VAASGGVSMRCLLVGMITADSPLEGAGFELSVPREIGFVSRLVGRLLVRRIEGADQ